MAYRRIDVRMWDDEKFIDLSSSDVKLIWSYLLTGPQTTMLPGLYVAGIGTLIDGLRMSPETVSKGLAELSSKGLVEVDERLRVIRLPNAPRHNAPENPNVVKGWFRMWKALPESPLKHAHLQSLRAVLPAGEGFQEAWAKGFGTVTQTVSKTGSGSGSGSGSLPLPPRGPGGGEPTRTEPEPSTEAEPPPVEAEPEREPEPPPAQQPIAVAPKPATVANDEHALPFEEHLQPPRAGNAIVARDEAALKADCERVFACYRTKIEPSAAMTPQRENELRKWLKTYTAEKLIKSVTGYAESKFWRGDNKSKADLVSFKRIFEDGDSIEKGWKLFDEARAQKPSESSAPLAKRQAERPKPIPQEEARRNLEAFKASDEAPIFLKARRRREAIGAPAPEPEAAAS